MNKYYINCCTGDKAVVEERKSYLMHIVEPNKPTRTGGITEENLHKFYIPITKAEYDSSLTLEEIKRNRHTNKDDKVNHPSHYTWLKDLCGIEVIDITRHLDFDCGNAVKYLLRAGHKEEKGYTDKDKTIEDLKKAIFYINDKIKMLQDDKKN